MKGLLYKEFLILRKYSILLLIYFVLTSVYCLVPAVISEDAPYSGAVMCSVAILATALIFSTFTISSLAIDEASGWMRQALLIISRKQYLLSKYLFHVLTGGIGALISTGILLAIVIWSGEADSPYVLSTILFSAIGAMEANLYMGAVLIPLLVKFGTDKGRFLWLLVFLPVGAILFGMANVSFDLLAAIVLPITVLVLLPAVAIIFGVMLIPGMKWIMKKEV